MMRWMMILPLVALAPLPASAQGKRTDATVIYKDGFIVKGSVHENSRTIFDKETGRAFNVGTGDFFIDDGVRAIMFSPGQVLKVNRLKDGELPTSKPVMRFDNIPSLGKPLDPTWTLESLGDWTETGDRKAYVVTPKGNIEMDQRIAGMSPQYLVAFTVHHRWIMFYSTQEYGPVRTRAYLENAFAENPKLKGIKAAEKYRRIAGFLQEAGFFAEAEKELVNITENFPDEKKTAETMLVKLRKDRAELYVESIELAKKAGQHADVIERLDVYDKLEYAKIVAPDYLNRARGLKEDYERDKLAVEDARRFLKEMPAKVAENKAAWVKAAAFISDGLNIDTVERLDEFIRQAKQYERQRKGKLELTHSAEQVLAFAVTGWLQGKDSFDKDTKLALKLIDARETLVSYLKSDDEATRARLLKAFQQNNEFKIDVLTRLIRLLPPADPHDAKKLDTSVQTIQLAGGGTYQVQLPPEYHHQRAYPVLMAFAGRETKEEFKGLSDEAARQGYILVIPEWGGKTAFGAKKYQYGKKDHDLVLETLRDLRRRFQVDSDRVFVFGFAEGANMAFDIGLAHPDQFAGVVPMNGAITRFAQNWYWPNAQYLPFYVVTGENNGLNAKILKQLFKEHWTRRPFASMYVEYRGRASEWFSAEIPTIFKWMACKKRDTPNKELGDHDLGHHFRSSRNTDTRFYWLSCEAIDNLHLHDHTDDGKNFRYRPATFQANLSLGNVLNKQEAKEKIWNRAIIRTTGLKQVTLWITPEMNFTNKLELIVNGQVRGMRDFEPRLETLLEELQQSGDRQRLFVGKIEIKT